MPSQVVVTPKGAIIKTEMTRVKTGFCSSLEEKCGRNESHESIIQNAFIFSSISINNEEMLRTRHRLILSPQICVNQYAVQQFSFQEQSLPHSALQLMLPSQKEEQND